MTRDDLLAWARTYAAADARFRAARVAWAQRPRGSFDDAEPIAAEYRVARTAMEAAETGLDELAAAIIEHVPDAPERHHGRTRWDGAQ